jgi:hypothetical protein
MVPTDKRHGGVLAAEGVALDAVAVLAALDIGKLVSHARKMLRVRRVLGRNRVPVGEGGLECGGCRREHAGVRFEEHVESKGRTGRVNWQRCRGRARGGAWGGGEEDEVAEAWSTSGSFVRAG